MTMIRPGGHDDPALPQPERELLSCHLLCVRESDPRKMHAVSRGHDVQPEPSKTVVHHRRELQRLRSYPPPPDARHEPERLDERVDADVVEIPRLEPPGGLCDVQVLCAEAPGASRRGVPAELRRFEFFQQPSCAEEL